MKKDKELEITEYIVLQLCCFVLPSEEEFKRVETFKTSKIVTGFTYSLVPTISASIYEGLMPIYNCLLAWDLGKILHSFLGHFLFELELILSSIFLIT